MIIDTKEAQCVMRVLTALQKGKTTYTEFKKAADVSHTTLQRALEELVRKKFIKKHDIGHQNVDYEVTEIGRKLLKALDSVHQILK